MRLPWQKPSSVPPLAPRVKARLVVSSLQQQVLTCLAAQGHVFGYQTDERLAWLETLGENLHAGDWAPPGLTPEEIAAIDPALFAALVLALGSGKPIAGYEGWLHDDFQARAQGLPPLRYAGRHRRDVGRRRGPRAELP